MTACLTDQDLGGYVGGSATPEQMSAWNEHLDECHGCARRVIKAQSDRSNPTGDGNPGPAGETITVKPPVDAALDAGPAFPKMPSPATGFSRSCTGAVHSLVFQRDAADCEEKVRRPRRCTGPSDL